MKRVVFIGLMLFCPISFGQEVLTLQSCLDKVKANFLQTSVELSLLKQSQINRQFHWWRLLPDLSANVGINTSFGRRLDPFTNTFATSSVNSQSFGLNSSIQLFNGFTYFYQRNVLNAAIERDEISLDAKLNELKTEVVETYIALCKLAAQMRLTEVRIEKYGQIQQVQRLLLREGRINAIDTLKSSNSLLAEQGLLMDLANESRLKMIRLNFQMGLPLGIDYLVESASIPAIEDKLHFAEKYRIESLETEMRMLTDQLKAERSKVLPGLSLSGLVGTGFSTNNKEYSLAGTPTKLYRDQINQNLYEGIGLYLTVPLFNRGEWLKIQRLNEIQRTELTNRKELADQLLLKEQLEQEERRLNQRAKLEQSQHIAENLRIVYDKSLLLYEEGRLTYSEIETALMEWQSKLVDCELLKIDNQLFKLYD